MITGLKPLSGKYPFYGRRKGHALSLRRQKLLETFLPELLIDAEQSGYIDLPLMFNKIGEVWLEIGFGAGEHLAAQASVYPNVNFIGCEPYINGVARLLTEIKKRSLTNIRIYDNDARFLIEKLGPASIDRVFILFPDPWPKKRHNRRRFINFENLNELSRVMKKNAELRFATDDMNLVRWTLNMFQGHPKFKWLVVGPHDWENRFVDSVPTRYEKKALKLGKRCIYLKFQHTCDNLV